MTLLSRSAALLTAFTVSLFSTYSRAGIDNNSSWYTVDRVIKAQNNRSWRAAFDAKISNNVVIISLAVNLIPSNVKQWQVDKVKAGWRNAIEHTWNNKYGVVTESGRILPIRFLISFASSKFHHRVIVNNSAPVNDQLNWSLQATPKSIAHEFGHMIGAFDEYHRGGLNPSQPVIDPQSIMATRGGAGQLAPRHFWLIRDVVAKLLGNDNITIQVLDYQGMKALTVPDIPIR
jgi:hypothetical protein